MAAADGGCDGGVPERADAVAPSQAVFAQGGVAGTILVAKKVRKCYRAEKYFLETRFRMTLSDWIRPASSALLVLGLLLEPRGATAAAPPAIDFFDTPRISAPALSPDGRYLAIRMSAPERDDWLSVIDLSDFSGKPVALFKGADVGEFRWINNQRLLYTATERKWAQGDSRYAPGLYAVDRDGKRFAQLASRSGEDMPRGRVKLQPWNTYLMEQLGAQDSELVYVYRTSFSNTGAVESTDLRQVDTVTGDSWYYEHPGSSQQWILDQQGKPRVLVSSEEGKQSLFYLDPKLGDWRQLRAHGVTPLGFGSDQTFYVVANAGKDKAAMYRYDLDAEQVTGQALVQLDGFDFSGTLIANDKKLLGAQVTADARVTVWFDNDMKALQAEVDALLPTTVNLLQPPRRPEAPWILVVAFSDRQPDRYLVYNTSTKRLREISRQAPRIHPEQMGVRELVYYKSRDGRDIPAWLTLPPGVGTPQGLPMVVLVHGGPFVRGGDWRWDASSQFLATRGYVVLEPEFRGSSGYGASHFTAGFKQWGLKMQDDIADGTRWAIAKGMADPRRICIAGGSYGGYATLMGLIKDPDLFKCGVDWLGVTDIELMYDPGFFHSSDLSENWKTYGMPEMIGDRVKDAAQLKATSPLQQAERLTQPLLMAYGGADRRVPINHGTKFLRAVRKTNSHVEWIEYSEEGHGWYLVKNRVDFWTRVEKFLEQQIGKAAP
jgi:dipeptidyl aminopeptidase/acylaminoacyl peptidase